MAPSGNALHGDVFGTSVQAGRIHGGVHLHLPTPPPGHYTPWQVPPPVRPPIDRVHAHLFLDEVHATGRAVTVISGLPGIGKSFVVRAWATNRIELFPDGQLYVDLGGHSPAGTRDPHEVLGTLLASLGVPAGLVPTATADRTALLRTRLTGPRVLLVLDDAVSVQLPPLLVHTSTCMLVVTARGRLDWLTADGAAYHLLPPLADSDARALLAASVGTPRLNTEPTQTAMIVRLCGGIPLALAITAARLAHHPTWTLRRISSDLDGAHSRLEALTMSDRSVSASLDTSYATLPANTVVAYHALGVHPTPTVDPGAIAAAINHTTRATIGLLNKLAAASLLEEPATDTHYQCNTLVYDHARAKGPVMNYMVVVSV